MDKPEDWPYSSYPEYISLRKGTLPQPEIVLDQFGSSPSRAAEAYRCLVEEAHEENLPTHLLLINYPHHIIGILKSQTSEILEISEV